MKKTILGVMLLLAAAPVLAAGKGEKGEIIKTGFNFGPLPVVGFDSDLGFQYGVCCDIFNYGDGSGYPSYDYKINVEASTYTKGSSVLRSYGDFKKLIPGGKLFYDVTYFSASKFGFYGYNGYASPYDADAISWLGTPGAADSKSAFNFMQRKQFRALVSIQKQIVGNLNWAAGLAFYNVKTGDVNTDKIKDAQGQWTLYDTYKLAGLIRDNEAEGGNVTQLRAGLTYDSRDHDSDPTRGLNLEAALVYSPDIIDGNGYSNLGFTFVGSQFIPVVDKKLTFAYRALLQAKLWGEIPWYFTNNLNNMFFRKMYTEGMGGNASVRGLNRNGVLGDGYFWLNAELRWRIIDFKFINQNWTVALNPFFDTGRVIQPYRLDEQKNLNYAMVVGGAPFSRVYSGNDDAFHSTAGCGFKLIMNHNMVVSFEAGKPFNENDGNSLWTNIGFNYLF